jgi:flagellar biosynthetic protein FlhB
VAKDRDQRTEPASQRKKREARKKGEVARSQTLIPWATLLVATYVLPGMVSGIAGELAEGLRAVAAVTEEPTVENLLAATGGAATAAFVAFIPLLLVTVVLAVVGGLAQTGFLLSLGPLKPKFERINPLAGFKRLFSARSLWETGKQVLLVALIVLVSLPALRGVAELLAGSAWPLSAGLAEATRSILSVTRLIAVIGTVAGVADYAWQRWSFMRDQRMTKEEVKREHKDNEGDPHIKAKLRSLRAAMTRNSMLAAAAEADLVITNPTHVAVALVYDPSRGAPRVVAAGTDHLALRIRERAAAAGVPRVEAPPLARALHRACRVDDEIPKELFQAVATVLAFVHRVGARSLVGGASLDVPDTWTPAGADPRSSLSDLRQAPGERRRRQRMAATAARMADAAASAATGSVANPQRGA